ncbi:FG-GAP repeat protein [bacterium]|nr:FG-GAP repeat protein [bacterium]
MTLLLSSAGFAQPASIRQRQLLPTAPLRAHWKHLQFTPMVETDCRPGMLKSYKFSDRQLPWAVLGDFNGDGKTDLVVDGHSGAHFLRLAFLSPGYTVTVVEKGQWTAGDHWTYLKHMPPGVHDMPIGDQKTVTLKSDAFCEVFPEKAAIMHYWKGGRFQEYYLSD